MSNENSGGAGEQPEPTVQELKDKITTLETEKTNLVEDVKGVRKSKQELQVEIDSLKNDLKNIATQIPQDNTQEIEKIANVVKRVLGERDVSRAQDNKKSAFEKFVTSHNEFHPDNDISGLKLEALKRKFASFNTNELVNEKDFMEVLEDSYKLLRKTDLSRQGSEEGDEDFQTSSISGGVNSPKSVGDNKLTNLELKTIEKLGMSKERYLKLKSKDPKYMENLFATAR